MEDRHAGRTDDKERRTRLRVGPRTARQEPSALMMEQQGDGIDRIEARDNDMWEEARWEDIVTRPPGERVNIQGEGRDWGRCTKQQEKLRDQQRASRRCNKHPTQYKTQQNLAHFRTGAETFPQTQVPTVARICAAMSQEGAGSMTTMADTARHTKMADTIYEARTQEEALVKDLLEQWRRRGHGYVPDEKGDNRIQLGCENVNSLSLFHPTKSKQKKLLNLHNRYQTDGACILEHGINF
jgi:hypothetical protein